MNDTIRPAYARVHCPHCGIVNLDASQYEDQLIRVHEPWTCPTCHSNAEFDDTHYDELHGAKMKFGR